MKLNRTKKIWIIAGACLGVGILCVIFFWLLPKLFGEWINADELETFLEDKSGWQGLCYLALFQAVQVLTVFLPGAAVQIAGGLVFGTLRSAAVCLISFTAANAAVFALVRRRADRTARSDTRLGRSIGRVLEWINSSDPSFMCMLAYMMPGIPNGFVPYAAARTSVSFRSFTAAVLRGSAIQILIMCSVGSRIMSGDFAVSFFLVLGSIALIVLLWWQKERIVTFRQRHLHPRSAR